VHVWAFDMNLHPMGYQQVADDDPAYINFLRTERGDPRRGPLFAIVHALLQRSAEEDSA